MNHKINIVIGFIFAGSMIPIASSVAQNSSSVNDYPNRTIRMVVGYAPGGGADIMGRHLSEQLTKQLGVPVIVENKPGGGQNVGASYVARSDPNGYTLLMSSSALAINPSIYKSINYDPKVDFEPIAIFAQSPNLMVVKGDSPYKNVQDIIDYGKSNSDDVNYSSSGSGSTQHLAGELLKIKSGLKATHIPYRGTGPSITALMSGDVDFSFANIPSASPQIAAGNLRPIAITSEKRSAILPDVPTMAESGLEGMILAPWYGVLAPAGTPQEIVEQLNEAINIIVSSEEFSNRIADLGATPITESSDYFRKFFIEDSDLWKEIVTQAGIESN